MAYPPPVLSTTRTNSSPQLTTHPADHVALAQGVNDLTDRMQVEVATRGQTTTGGSLPNATWTVLSAGTAKYTYGQLSGDAGGIITPVGGFFLAMGWVYWSGAASATGRRIVGFSNSSSVTPSAMYQGQIGGLAQGLQQRVTIPMRVAAAAGDRFYLWGYQDSGATLTIVNRDMDIVRLLPTF